MVDDGEQVATAERYARILDVEAVTQGPRRVLRLALGRVEIVAVSAFGEVLPGEDVPALPYMAGQTVAVTDLRAARTLVEDNGFVTRDLPGGGFFVGAAQARGAALAFRQVR